MRIEAWEEKASLYAVPLGVIIAALVFFYWYVFAGSFTNALWRSVSVLVVAYPFLLTRAVPAARTAGMARAARAGIRFRNTEAFERAARTSVVVFGKTGVLTVGRPDITDFIVFDDTLPLPEALYLAASLESKSTHPLARAIVEKGTMLTRARLPIGGQALATPFEYKEVVGMGVSGIVNGKHIEIGNLSFLEGLAGGVRGQDVGFGRLQSEGKTVVCMFVDKKLAALIACKDTLRPFAKETVAALMKQGKEIVLVTGDNKTTAEAFARSVGISAVYSELRLQEKTRVIAVVGSGEVRAALHILFGNRFARQGESKWNIACAGDDIRSVVVAFDISKKTTLIAQLLIVSQFLWYAVALGLLLLF